jgi:hypothetical protein
MSDANPSALRNNIAAKVAATGMTNRARRRRQSRPRFTGGQASFSGHHGGRLRR